MTMCELLLQVRKTTLVTPEYWLHAAVHRTHASRVALDSRDQKSSSYAAFCRLSSPPCDRPLSLCEVLCGCARCEPGSGDLSQHGRAFAVRVGCKPDKVAFGTHDPVLRGCGAHAIYAERPVRFVLLAPFQIHSESLGRRHLRAQQRGLLIRPGLPEVHRYCEHIDAAVLQALERVDRDTLKSIGPLIILGLQL